MLLHCFISTNVSAQYQLEKVVHEDQNAVENLEDLSLSQSQKNFDSKTINQQVPSSVHDVLQGTIEATTTRGPRVSGEGAQIRGLDAGKVYVLIDGVRQNYKEGHSTMIPVDMDNLKEVKIQKNSSDFSQSGSLGGGIEFISKGAKDYLKEDKNWGSEFSSKYFSANQERSINAKAMARKNRHATLISLTSSKANELKLNNGSTLSNSSFKDKTGLFKYHYSYSTVSYEKYYREDDNPLDPSLNPPNSVPSLQSDTTYHKDSFLYDFKKNDLKTNAYLNQYLTKKKDRESNNVQKRKIQTLGGQFKNSYEEYYYGVEWFQDKLRSELSGQSLADYPDASSLNTSAYIQKSIELGQLKLTPGFQFSHYYLKASNDLIAKNDGERLSKKIQLDYSYNNNLGLYALYSEGFNAPKVAEAFPEGLHSPGDGWIFRDNYFIPNEKLKHETSSLREIGVNFKKNLFHSYDQLSFKTSYHENYIKDYIRIERIDRSTLDDEDGTSQFINVPRVKLHGVEMELGYFYDQLDISIGYSKIRGKNMSDDLFLEDLPADQIIYNLKYNFESYKFNIGYLGIQTYEQDRINPQTTQRTEATPGYYIHNAYAEKAIGQYFDLSLRGNNIGNKNYRRHASFLNESSEDYRVMLKFKINTL